MEPGTHFIISTIAAIVLFPFYKWLVLLIILGGVLVDIDHYLYYVVKFKDYNLKKAIKFYRKITLKKDVKLYGEVIRIFHTIEFLIVVLIGAFFSKYLLLIAIGSCIHVLMDISAEIKIFKHLTPRYSLLGILG